MKEGGREGLLNAALCFVQSSDPLSTFPRAGQHTQDESKERNAVKGKEEEKVWPGNECLIFEDKMSKTRGFKSFYVVSSSQNKSHTFSSPFHPLPPPYLLPLGLLSCLSVQMTSLTVLWFPHARTHILGDTQSESPSLFSRTAGAGCS